MLQFYFLISDLSDSGAARVGGVKAWQVTFTMLREKTAHAYQKRTMLSQCTICILYICHVID